MKITKIFLILAIFFVNIHSVGAFNQRDLNEFNLYKTEYDFTIHRLKTLNRTVENYNQKRAQAQKNGDEVSLKRYLAKLEDAKYQRYELTEHLADVNDELDSFDELRESSIAQN